MIRKMVQPYFDFVPYSVEYAIILPNERILATTKNKEVAYRLAVESQIDLKVVEIRDYDDATYLRFR